MIVVSMPRCRAEAAAVARQLFRPDHDRAAGRVALEGERTISLRRVNLDCFHIARREWSLRRSPRSEIRGRTHARVPLEAVHEERRLAIRRRDGRRVHRDLAALSIPTRSTSAGADRHTGCVDEKIREIAAGILLEICLPNAGHRCRPASLLEPCPFSRIAIDPISLSRHDGSQLDIWFHDLGDGLGVGARHDDLLRLIAELRELHEGSATTKCQEAQRGGSGGRRGDDGAAEGVANLHASQRRASSRIENPDDAPRSACGVRCLARHHRRPRGDERDREAAHHSDRMAERVAQESPR